MKNALSPAAELNLPCKTNLLMIVIKYEKAGKRWQFEEIALYIIRIYFRIKP